MTRKLWGGRFRGAASRAAEAFTTSFPVDLRLYPEDIAGSIAHARMLGRQGIVPRQDAEQLVAGLGRVYAELESEGPRPGYFEDVHSYVEVRLRELIGEPAGRLHTARSRNDQVATDLRLWTRRALCDGVEAIAGLQEALLGVARAHEDALLPGYTHLQRAQPVLLAHHLLAQVEALSRDAERLCDAYARADVLPLGSGALAGVPYPLDRDYVARLLGFSRISRNSIDAVSDRDFVAEHLFALALLAVHLSRLADELVLWSTAEFGFVELDEAHATGSSIMPQKKNPDVAELVRGRSGRVIGGLVTLLTVLKGLPLAYQRDLQEDKEPYFDAVDTVQAALALSAEMIGAAQWNVERMASAAGRGFTTATDLADHLARLGVPFREAHDLVGAIVRRCLETGRDLTDLTPDELADLAPVLRGRAPDLSARASVASRDLPGGTAPRRVRAALEEATIRIASLRAWAASRRETLPNVPTLAALPWDEPGAPGPAPRM